MKLSMWMLAYELKPYSYQTNIQKSEMIIESISFFDTVPTFFQPRYAYLGYAKDYFSSKEESDALILVHQYSYILLYPMPIEHAINLILRTFEKYQKWESDVQLSCMSENPFQKMVNCSETIFHNPLTISDSEGNLLGCSSHLEGWEPDELWREIIRTQKLPRRLLTPNQKTSKGVSRTEWTTVPEIYQNEFNTCVGVHIESGGENVGGFAVSEILQPLTERDIQLAERLLEMIHAGNLFSRQESLLLSSRELIRYALEGKKPSEAVINRYLRQINPAPWQLIEIYWLQPIGSTLRHNLLAACRMSGIANTAIEEKACIYILAAEERYDEMLHEILSEEEFANYRIAISPRIRKFEEISLAKELTDYAIQLDQKQAGVVLCRDIGCEYFSMLLRRDAKAAELMVHPALRILREYDRVHHSELCHTLEIFLQEERNLVRSAARLFIHRNSLVWRIRRIHELISVDLNDPKEREILFYSFRILSE